MLNYIETIGLLIVTFGYGRKALRLIRTAVREGGWNHILAMCLEPEVAVALGRALLFAASLGKSLFLGVPPT